MRIADIGEFALIERLRQIVAIDHPDVVVGIGDDVAVLNTGGDAYTLATVDAQVEEVHFLRHLISPQQLGRRALAINLSDIAAMGGTPQFALVSLMLPSDTDVAWVEALYQGLRAEATAAGVVLVGGNMARSPAGISIDVTVLGCVRRDELLLRSGARPGDRVLVTGTLGEAAAGLRLARDPGLALAAPEREALLQRYLTPTPRLAAAALIAQSHQASAMLDISDGLSSDIGHICTRSNVDVRLWANALPISPATRAVAKQIGTTAWQLALTGGEDYELCFTAPAVVAAQLASQIQAATGLTITPVGEILPPGEGRWLRLADGQDVPLEAGGWEHFRQAGEET